MEQEQYSRKRKEYKHILLKERYVIENLIKNGFSHRKIAEIIGCDRRTVDREIKRGSFEHTNSDATVTPEYGSDVGERVHKERAKNKGPYAKINNAPKLRKYLENKIKNENFSPEAALMKIKEENREFEVEISAKTLYNNIDNGELDVNRKDLLRRGWKKKSEDEKKNKKAGHNLKGTSIEERPKEANERSEAGHWEIDLILGKKGTKPVLLTLTERMTRKEIIRKLPNKEQKTIREAMDKLEKELGKKFKKWFKTVTSDNGSEFLDFTALEKSINKDSRFKVYYAHPYSSFERGTNENANGLVRRFYPKGTDFSKVSMKRIAGVEDWINSYPRKILGGVSSNTFQKQISFA
jgi:IS30 family transposase